MARAIWTGSVSFGLVNVPVGLYSATRDHEVHFHQFEKGTSSRIRYERVNEDVLCQPLRRRGGMPRELRHLLPSSSSPSRSPSTTDGGFMPSKVCFHPPR